MLADQAARSPEGLRVADGEDKERTRLLYVGFTRARDHLVLAVRVWRGKAYSQWLDDLRDASGHTALQIPFDAEDGVLACTRILVENGRPLDVDTRVWRVGTARADLPDPSTRAPRWFERNPSTEDRPVYRISPSSAQTQWVDGPTAHIRRVERLATPARLEGKHADHELVGTAIHAFLAADVEGLEIAERHARATRLISAAGLENVLGPGVLLGAGDALRAWVLSKWPHARWRREVSIDAALDSPHGERRISGTIDLLLETSAGYVLIDHKSFPATTEPAWRAKVKGFLPQLAAYAAALDRLDGPPVAGIWVHLPLGGGMVEIGRSARR